MKQLLYFYTQNISPRHKYIIHFLEQRWGLSLEVITDWAEFKQLKDTPKINYSNLEDNNALQIKPHGLLSQTEIHQFNFSNLESDPLAFIFFLLTRYEEYVVQKRDQHQRFSASSSYLYQTHRLQQPVVDLLLMKLRQKLLSRFPSLDFKKHNFKTDFTIDIDQAFCYQHKTVKRYLGATARDAFNLNLKNLIDRKLSYFRLKKDPWNVYDFLLENAKQKTTQPTFFFLIGDYSTYNKNLPHSHKAFQQVIQSVDAWAKVGLHPSYNSFSNLATVQKEKHRLELILNKNITQSRQHYIQLSLPITYKNLIAAGITQDYSMGFADDIGFRAGTSFPFLWYDLQQEETTSLVVHPFCVMDVTLKNYKKYTLNQAKEKVDEIKKYVKKVDGIFCMITHNESLSNYGEWKGWGDFLLKYWT